VWPRCRPTSSRCVCQGENGNRNLLLSKLYAELASTLKSGTGAEHGFALALKADGKATLQVDLP